jgi:hypothetical protein
MDFTTLLVIALIIVVAVMMFSRSRRAGSGPIYGNRTGGVDQPTYDDPGYTSSGSIGGSVAEPPAQERSVGGTAGSSRTHDDPNYRSGGSIG